MDLSRLREIKKNNFNGAFATAKTLLYPKNRLLLHFHWRPKLLIVCCNVQSESVDFADTFPTGHQKFWTKFLVNSLQIGGFSLKIRININWHEYYTLFVSQLYNKQHVFCKHLIKYSMFWKNILHCDHNILFNIWLSFKSQSKSWKREHNWLWF